MKKSASVSISSAARFKLTFMLAVLLLPLLASFFTDHQARSKWEKRELNQLPEWQGFIDPVTYFNDINKFIDDHIGFAKILNGVYRQALFYVFRDSPVTNITIGKDGFVFFTSHNAKRKNDIFTSLCVNGVNEKAVALYSKNINTIFSDLQSRGYRPSLGIPVSKPVLYPEYLPGNVPENLRASCAEFINKNTVVNNLAFSPSFSDWAIHYPLKEFVKLKDQKGFYPKENFHWNGMSAHYFAKGFFSKLGIDVDESFSEGAKLIRGRSDLKMTGFAHIVDYWDYDYKQFGVKDFRRQPKFIKEYYKRALDFTKFETAKPLSDRSALVISNSFGAFTAPHLAPGFKTLYHINVNHLKPAEAKLFYTELIDKLSVDDVIFIFHDDAVTKKQMFKRFIDVVEGQATIAQG